MWYASSASGFIYGWRSFTLIIFSSTEYVILGADQFPCECWRPPFISDSSDIQHSKGGLAERECTWRNYKKKDAQEHTQLMGRVVYHSYMRIAMAIFFQGPFFYQSARYQYNTAIHPFFYRFCH
jgi:hypothetical protein